MFFFTIRYVFSPPFLTRLPDVHPKQCNFIIHHFVNQFFAEILCIFQYCAIVFSDVCCMAKFRARRVRLFPLDFVGARPSCLFTNVYRKWPRLTQESVIACLFRTSCAATIIQVTVRHVGCVYVFNFLCLLCRSRTLVHILAHSLACSSSTGTEQMHTCDFLWKVAKVVASRNSIHWEMHVRHTRATGLEVTLTFFSDFAYGLPR